MRPPRRPPPPATKPGDVEWHFLEARRLMDAGRIRAAMEQAGFGIRLDLGRPDGYLMLGELNLLEGDLLEARRSFAAAASRSRGETRCAALAGSAQVAWIAGDLAEARAFYEQALREDASDPLNLRPALIEVLLRAGDLPAAGPVLAKCEDDSADVHLLAAWFHRLRGDPDAAVASIRRACLANVYLSSVLAGEKPPELGLAHGVEEATPEHAEALVERMTPFFRDDRAAAAFLSAVTRTPTARHEREELIRIALALQREPQESRRKELKRDLEAVRDPARIAASAKAALAEAGRDQSAPPPCSFEV